MDNENTGNRKCWHVIDLRDKVIEHERLTLRQARQLATTPHRGYCRDGFKLVQCDGEAHDNPHIDNCMQCAPRWGWVMVPESSTHLDWCDECFQALRRGVASDCPDAPEELRRELTPVEKTLLGALK